MTLCHDSQCCARTSNFHLGDTALCHTARRFASFSQREDRPPSCRADRPGQPVSPHLWPQMARARPARIDHRGRRMTARGSAISTMSLAMERSSRASASVGSPTARIPIGHNQIGRHGTAAQKAKVPAGLISGEHVRRASPVGARLRFGCGSRCAPAAEKKCDSLYVLTGNHHDVDHNRPHRRGRWSSNAKTDPRMPPARITAFLIEKGMKGFLRPIQPARQRSACAAEPASSSSRIAKACRKRNVLGQSAKGVNVLSRGLDYTRAVFFFFFWLAARPLASMQPA